MAVEIAGHIVNRWTGAGTSALWIEVWHGDRLVARAAAPSDRKGKFRLEADDRELGRWCSMGVSRAGGLGGRGIAYPIELGHRQW